MVKIVSIVFKLISASALFLNFSLDILIKYILIEKRV